MLNINQGNEKLIGRVLYNGEVIGTCSAAETFYDIACEIKARHAEVYAAAVDAQMPNGYMRTLHYDFNPDGTLRPASQGGIKLWHDRIDEKLLYLHNFINDYGDKEEKE